MLQVDNGIVFISIATISLSIHSLSSKPSFVVSQLSDYLSAVYTPQSNLTWGP